MLGRTKSGDAVCIVGRQYNVSTQYVYTNSDNKNITVPKNCNGWLATNLGTVSVKVNDHILKPPPTPADSGESWGPNGNPGDIYTGQIQVVFNVGAGGVVMIDFYTYIV